MKTLLLELQYPLPCSNSVQNTNNWKFLYKNGRPFVEPLDWTFNSLRQRHIKATQGLITGPNKIILK